MADALTNAELLSKIDDLPWGPRLRDEANSVVALAQERADIDLEFGARMRLTANGVMTGVTDVALTNFAWCAAKHKEDPARFFGEPHSESDQIFWHYKWMPGLVSRSPAFERAQVDAVLEDFEQTYRDAGLPLSAVVTARFETAMNLGDLAAAEQWGSQLAGMPTDPFSSCDACVPSDFVDLDLMRGDEAAAVARAVESWDDGNSCAEEPESMLATVLIPMLRLGKLKKAKKAYTLVYNHTHSDPDKVVNASYCALFASVTGNHELALSHVERHLLWLVHDALSEADHLKAAANFAVALERLIAARDAADILIRGSADPALAAVLPKVDEPRTARELASALWGLVDDLAARFDERNGNDHRSAAAAATRALVHEEYPLELDRPASFAPFTVRPATPSTAQEWLEKAIDSWWAKDLVGTAQAAGSALGGELAAPIDRVRAASLAVAAAVELDDTGDVSTAPPVLAALQNYVAEVEACFGADSVELARAAVPGAPADALVAAVDASPDAAPQVRSRVLGQTMRPLLMQEGGPSEDDLRTALALLDRALELVEPAQFPDAPREVVSDAVISQVSVLCSRAQVRNALGDAQGGLADLDTAYAHAPSRPGKAAVLHLRSLVLGGQGDHAAAALALDESASLYAASGHERAALLRSLDSANAWLQSDDASAGAARFEYAAGLLPADETLPLGVRWNYAGALLAAEEADRAVPLLEGILAEELAAMELGGDGNPVRPNEAESLAQTYYRLARALDESYDSRAGAHYSRSAQLFAHAGSHGAAAGAGLSAAREYWYQEDLGAAAEALEFAAAHEESDPNPQLRYDLTMLLAQVSSATDDANWEQHITAAVELARELDNAEQLAATLSTRLSMHAGHGQHREVLALAPEALDAALSADEGDQAVGGLWHVAQAHIAMNDADGAAAALAAYRGRASEFGHARDNLGEMGAEVLRSIDRPDDAVRWLASVTA